MPHVRLRYVPSGMEKCSAVEQVFYADRLVGPGAEGRFQHPGDEPGFFNRILFPLTVDAFADRLVQHSPILFVREADRRDRSSC